MIFKNRGIFVLLAFVWVLSACQNVLADKNDYSQYFAKFGTWANLDIATQRGLHRVPYIKVNVEKGDTLYNLSKKYEVSTGDLIAINRLKKPYTIHLDQELKVPFIIYHKVAGGDTVRKLAKKYASNSQKIIAANNLNKPYILKLGQKIRIPKTKQTQALIVADNKNKPVNSTPKVSQKKRKTLTNAQLQRLQQARLKNNKLNKTPKVYGEIKTAKIKNIPPSSKKKTFTGKNKGRFYWPTKGEVIAKFGAQKSGVQNDGINIAAGNGAKIKASDNGTVVYAGRELKGYGNLLIIKHNGGWLTAYAHIGRFAVKKGAKIKKGQVIGYIGQTGNVERPQLHFAIRKGKDVVDPMKYLTAI